MKDATVSSDGIPVCFETDGTGSPALIFVHGWSCDRGYWLGQLALAARYRVVTVDLAGHGESGAGRAAWTMPAFGDDVVAVVEKLALDHVVLIGHSMGGDVIVEAALRLAGRVVGLVWADVYSTLGNPRAAEEIERIAAPFHEDFVTAARELVGRMFVPESDPDLVEWIVSDMSSAPPEIAVDELRHAIGNEGAVLDGLHELRAPVVAINPDYRPTDIEALERYGVRTRLMSGVGHFLMMEDPDTFNRLLEDAIVEFCSAS